LLSIVDSIERAVSHVPEDLKENSWTDGVVKMAKNLDKMLSDLGLTKIQITPGKTPFDPELHNAVQADDTDGDTEVVAEELMTGYKKDNFVLRPAMVKVTHIHSDKKDK
jgi:molecular chaperone GrpE